MTGTGAWEDGFVDNDGVRLAVRDHGGSGPPLVLIHGHLGNLASFDHLPPLLRTHARVVAYDQRGHGWSESGPTTIGHYVADLVAVIGAFGLERPLIYGQSFGAVVALAYILGDGELAGFINEDGQVTDPRRPPGDAPPVVADEPTIVSAEGLDRLVAAARAFGDAGVATAMRSHVRRPDGRFQLRPNPAELAAEVEMFLASQTAEAYRRCPAPVLLLAAVPPDPSARTERESDVEALGSAVALTVRWFETSHWVSAEDPQGVADSIAGFIAELPRSPG